MLAGSGPAMGAPAAFVAVGALAVVSAAIGGGDRVGKTTAQPTGRHHAAGRHAAGGDHRAERHATFRRGRPRAFVALPVDGRLDAARPEPARCSPMPPAPSGAWSASRWEQAEAGRQGGEEG